MVNAVAISDLTKQRFKHFRGMKRAWYSLIILSGAFLLSIFSELIANDKPYILSYRGGVYFPLFKFYPETDFGGRYKTEPDYSALGKSPAFVNAGGWMLRPPIPHSPLNSYLDNAGTPPHSPSLRHWLGTDSMARDVLTRLIYGFRICMVFSLMLCLLSAVLGTLIGGIQGYLGGRADLTMQRFIEIWSSMPYLYVVILLGAVYGRSFALLLFVTAIFQWIGLSYYMRGEILKLKNLTYVKVAHSLGFGPMRIFWRHLLPNALTPVITILPFTLVAGISALTALDFLGFGLQPPTPSWGELLSQGLENLYAPWIAISTIMALFITLLLATFIGEGVREAFDPKAGKTYE